MNFLPMCAICGRPVAFNIIWWHMGSKGLERDAQHDPDPTDEDKQKYFDILESEEFNRKWDKLDRQELEELKKQHDQD